MIPLMMYQIVTTLRAESTAEFQALGFNIQGARVLVIALLNPGISIGDLAEITCIDPTALSHLLARLSRERLLKRVRDKIDARFVGVYLTKKGEELAKGCRKASLDRERRILRNIPREEVEQFRLTLGKIFESVRQDANADAWLLTA